jgi:hypothetical protein
MHSTDSTRDASGARVGGSAFKKSSISRAVDMPCSSCDHRALPHSGPPDGVRQCSLEGSASRSSLPVTSRSESARSWRCRRSCLLLAAVGGVQPHGSWHPSTNILLQGFSSRSPVATSGRGSSRRMTTSLGGEKRARLRPPPCPQLQGCSSSTLGRGACRVGASPSSWASGPLLPPAFGGEGRLPALRRRRTPGTRGRPSVAPSAATCLAPQPGCLWCRLRRCLLPLGRSLAAHPPHGRWWRRARVGHIHGFSRAIGRTGRSYKTSYAAGAAAAFLDGLVLTPIVRTGAKTSSCALVQPLPIGAEVVAATSGLMWSPPLVKLPTAEVVASTGESVSATCRRTSGSLALMASLSPPIGGRGRGPICSSTHPEVTAAAGEPLGAEVIVVAGAEVAAVVGGAVRNQLPARLLLVQRSPFLQKWS